MRETGSGERGVARERKYHEVTDEEGEERDGGGVVFVFGVGPGGGEDDAEGPTGDPAEETYCTRDVGVHQRHHFFPHEHPPRTL